LGKSSNNVLPGAPAMSLLKWVSGFIVYDKGSIFDAHLYPFFRRRLLGSGS